MEWPSTRAPSVEPEAPRTPEVDGVDEDERGAAVDGASRQELLDLLHRAVGHPLVDEAPAAVGVGGEVETLRVGAVVADTGNAEGAPDLDAAREEHPVGDAQRVVGALRPAVQRRQ